MEFNHIDIHSHLNFPQYDADRDAVIADMKAKGIATICVGTGPKTSQESVDLAEKHDNIFATIGVHPTDWEEGFDEELFDTLAAHPKVVAIGECGLDYFRLAPEDDAAMDAQEALFLKHIELAQKHNLPLMIHARPRPGTMDAYEAVLDILETQPPLSGNIHFFVGTPEIAHRFLDLGFTLSFDGPVTFSNDYDETIKSIPSGMIMAETDAPFAAPAPYRGKRNEPGYVAHVADRLAEIRGEDKDAFRLELLSTAGRVFPKLGI